jgi:RNA polymerase sigma-70 factor (ECF subfamily)
MVLRRCRRLLGNEDDALEAMQDVFVQVLRCRERLDARAPCSLLYRVATNVCLNRIRSRGRRPEVSDGELVFGIAAAADPESRSFSRWLLANLFGGEPESTATIAALHLVDGLTLEEVAREVGLSVSGVRKRLRKMKARLAELEVA